MEAIGDSTLDILSGILPWLLAVGALVGLVIVLPLFALGSVIARNWVMHVINKGHQFLATPPEAIWSYLDGANADLDAHVAEKLEQSKVWPLPEQPAKDDVNWPTQSSPYHGFGLTAWMLHAALFILCFVADLIFLGLGATYMLGLPLEAAAGKAVAFGLTLEAILAALAAITPGTVFGATISAIKGAAADGDKPWGNTSPAVRRQVQRICWIGLGVWAFGVICFALYRADLMVADAAGASLTGRRLLATLPYIFIPVFTVTLGVASILTFWSVLVGINALYLLGCLLIRRVFGLVAWLAMALVVGVDRWDAFVVSIWDWICKGPNTVWNASARAGGKILGMPLEKINHCERVVIGSGRSPGEYDCYCTPRADATAEPSSLIGEEPPRGQQHLPTAA